MWRISWIPIIVAGILSLSGGRPWIAPLASHRAAPQLEAQTPDLAALERSYPYLNLEKNRLYVPNQSQGLTGFFARWENLLFAGEGQINIYHIGGSHVQAGMLGNRMRENFHALSGDAAGERGFFFPYKVAGTNGPAQFRIEHRGKWEACRNAVSKHHCDWGLAGIQATTRDERAWIKISAQRADGRSYPFQRARIFHPADSLLFCLETDMEGLRSIAVDSSGRWTVMEFDCLHDTLSFSLTKTEARETHFTLGGISLEHDIPGLTYNEIGVNGASVPSYLRSPYFAEEMAHRPPHLVIFGIGINDANVPVAEFSKETFKSNYRELMRRIRSANPAVEFLFITNNDSYYNKRAPNKNAITVRQAMMELAEEEGAVVWDLFEVMGGLGSILKWQKDGLAKADKIHLTLAGYELVADLMFDAIRNEFTHRLRQRYLVNQNTD